MYVKARMPSKCAVAVCYREATQAKDGVLYCAHHVLDENRREPGPQRAEARRRSNSWGLRAWFRGRGRSRRAHRTGPGRGMPLRLVGVPIHHFVPLLQVLQHRAARLGIRAREATKEKALRLVRPQRWVERRGPYCGPPCEREPGGSGFGWGGKIGCAPHNHPPVGVLDHHRAL